MKFTSSCKVFGLSMLLFASVHAQTAGEVEFSQGLAFAHRSGEPPQALGRGVAVREGDRLTTLDGGIAVVRLQDGTRFTVRPNSEVSLNEFRFRQGANDNSLVLGLVRGGLRTLTGLVSKGSTQAARVQTSTATIGIRGTDFDARICARDCQAEGAQVPTPGRPNATQASGRLASSSGEVHATDASGTRRKVAVGGGVYPGDMLETAEGGQAVVFFRDGGRVALGATTRMRVDNFVYDPASASDGRFLASILQGTVRSETGEIARANPRNVIFTSSLATVSAPAGGVDMQCTGACVSDASGPSGGLTVVARTGGANVTAARSPQAHVLQPGQAIFIGAQGAQAVTTPPQFADAPLPAQVAAPAGLFGNTDVSESEEGVYVLVRDGHIELRGAREVVHLGRGEAGLARLDGTTARPVTVPRFLQFDRTPLPTSTRPIVTSMLQTSAMGGSAAGGLCR